MANKDHVKKALEEAILFVDSRGYGGVARTMRDALELLKEQEAEYENGFNDAMLGKQELMYEGTDGKWHRKDW